MIGRIPQSQTPDGPQARARAAFPAGRVAAEKAAPHSMASSESRAGAKKPDHAAHPVGCGGGKEHNGGAA